MNLEYIETIIWILGICYCLFILYMGFFVKKDVKIIRKHQKVDIMEINKIYNEDCLEGMKQIEDTRGSGRW